MKTGKPLYLFVTRRLLGWKDREGAGGQGMILAESGMCHSASGMRHGVMTGAD